MVGQESVRLRRHTGAPFTPRMPRNPKYPLEPLREHRDRKVELATAQLGEAVRSREAADDAKRRAEQERVEAAARAAAVRDDEAARLANGELRVADLARAQAWEHATSAEMANLEHAVDRADTEVGAARDREAGARTELAQKKADLDVVAKDRARFDAGVRRAQDANEEESAEEAFAARRSKA